jgi:hypothetical protein
MVTRTWCRAMTMGMMVALAVSGAQAASPAELAAAARAAAKDFRPLSPADVQQAKVESSAAVATLAQRLGVAGDNGVAWRKYLQIDQLEAELRKPEPDLAVLERIDARFAAGYAGLELVWFSAARRAIEDYVAIARSVDDPKLQSRYEQLVQNLAQHLEAFGSNPTAEESQRINADLRWLINARQASQLVESIRQSLQVPNGLIDVSAGTIEAAIGTALNETAPVQDCILGTSIAGTGHTTGQLTSQLSPADQCALIDTLFTGRTDTTTQGHNGPAVICSDGATCLSGVKRLAVTEEGLSATAAASSANTSTTITGVSVSSRLRMVLRIATRRVYQQKPLAEQIASQHAAWRLSERMDRQGNEMVANNNQAYEERIKGPLWERSLWPQLHFSSVPEWLRIVGVEAQPNQITGIQPAPGPVEGADLSLRIHESALNNAAATGLSGVLFHDEEIQSYAQRLLGYVPEELKADAEKEPWAIRMASQQPVTVTFGDDQFRVTARGDEYMRGDGTYPAMNVTATYKIVRNGTDVKAVRQGPVDVLPPRFVPGSGEQLSGREVAIRNLLEKRFDKIFRAEISSKDLVLKPGGDWAKIGTLVPVFWTSKQGWMTMAWRRTGESTKVAAAE